MPSEGHLVSKVCIASAFVWLHPMVLVDVLRTLLSVQKFLVAYGALVCLGLVVCVQMAATSTLSPNTQSISGCCWPQ